MLKENSGFPVYVPQDFDNSKLPKLTQRYFEVTGEASFTPIYDMKLPPAAIEAMNSGLQELTIGAKTPEQLAQDIQTALENAQ